MDRATDRDLVEQAKGGDLGAFGELVRRHQQRIHALTTRLLRSAEEADDVTQEAFVRAYKAIGRFDGRSEPYTWLYRIAVNLSLNALRSRKARGVVSLDDPQLDLGSRTLDGGAGPAAQAEDRELAAALEASIDTLSETLRTTLLLVCIEGLSHEDAGRILGCPEGTVAWRVHEARRKLREQLTARGFGGGDA